MVVHCENAMATWQHGSATVLRTSVVSSWQGRGVEPPGKEPSPRKEPPLGKRPLGKNPFPGMTPKKAAKPILKKIKIFNIFLLDLLGRGWGARERTPPPGKRPVGKNPP